jgi:tetratricopeptide (TPR) repeat protein
MRILFALLTTIASLAQDARELTADQVVERFPAGFSRRAANLRAAANARIPEHEAARLAQEYLQQGKRWGDAQSINLGTVLLEPIQARSNLGAEGLLTLAGLRSYQHDFAGALTLLDRAILHVEFRNEALLQKVSILITLGRYNGARTVFTANPPLLGTSRGTTLLALIASLTGRLESSYALLQRNLETGGSLSTGEASWTYGILAEMAERLGNIAAAETHYRTGLQAGPDIYLSNAWLDFLLGQKRFAEVGTFITSSPLREKLLLRKVIAAPTAEDLKALRSQLSQPSEHQRERSLFLLKVEAEPARALECALENWSIQKEPVDARLVLESAAALGDPGCAQRVIDWIDSNNFEDARLAHLLPNSL